MNNHYEYGVWRDDLERVVYLAKGYRDARAWMNGIWAHESNVLVRRVPGGEWEDRPPGNDDRPDRPARNRMPALRKADWAMLNTALGAYEAEDWQAVLGWTDEETEAHYRQLAETRQKVWARTVRWNTDEGDQP